MSIHFQIEYIDYIECFTRKQTDFRLRIQFWKLAFKKSFY